MAFISPNKQNSIGISQTYHGHDWQNPSDLSRQRAVDLLIATGSPVYAVESGQVVNVTYNSGGYVAIERPNKQHYLLYVHLTNFKVSVGQHVQQGQLLGYVDSANHLHLAIQNKNGQAPHPDLMSLFDQNINFTTNYKSIKNIWFKNGNLDWSRFASQKNKNINNNKNMETVTVQPGWGISHVAKAAGYDAADQSKWQMIAELNEYSTWQSMQQEFNKGSIIGKPVKVRKAKVKKQPQVDDKKVKELEKKLKQEQKRAAQDLANKVAEHQQKANSLRETIAELEQELNEEQIIADQDREKLESYKEINKELAAEVSKLNNQLESVTTFQKEDLPDVSPDMRRSLEDAGTFLIEKFRNWTTAKLQGLPDPIEVAIYYTISWVLLTALLFGAEFARSQGYGIPEINLTQTEVFGALFGGYVINMGGYKTLNRK